MKIFELEKFEDDEFDKFAQFSNDNWNEEWCIFLCSVGGSTWIEAYISEILKRKLLEPQSCYLNVAMAYSSAFILMMKFKGHINILQDARGMIHQASDTRQVNTSGKDITIAYTNYEDMLKKHTKIAFKEEIEFCKTFMTEKELEDYKNGKDIYYNEKQLVSLIRKQK